MSNVEHEKRLKYEMECDDCGHPFDSDEEHEDCPECRSEYTFVCRINERDEV